MLPGGYSLLQFMHSQMMNFAPANVLYQIIWHGRINTHNKWNKCQIRTIHTFLQASVTPSYEAATADELQKTRVSALLFTAEAWTILLRRALPAVSPILNTRIYWLARYRPHTHALETKRTKNLIHKITDKIVFFISNLSGGNFSFRSNFGVLCFYIICIWCIYRMAFLPSNRNYYFVITMAMDTVSYVKCKQTKHTQCRGITIIYWRRQKRFCGIYSHTRFGVGSSGGGGVDNGSDDDNDQKYRDTHDDTLTQCSNLLLIAMQWQRYALRTDTILSLSNVSIPSNWNVHTNNFEFISICSEWHWQTEGDRVPRALSAQLRTASCTAILFPIQEHKYTHT